MSESAIAHASGVRQRSPNQLRALIALSYYPFVAMMRNVATFAFGLIFPIVFIAVFGLIGGGVGGMRVGIVSSVATGPVNESLDRMPNLVLVPGERAELERQLRLGNLEGVISASGGAVSLAVNASSQQSGLVQLFVQSALDQANLRASGVSSPEYALSVGQVEGRRGRYIDFALPGQVGLAMLSTAIFGTVFGLLYLKKSLVLKRLFATPVHGLTILLGQGLARLALVMLQTAVILGIGVLAFGFQLANGWITFVEMMGMSALGLIVFLGFGLIIAGRTNDENSASPLANLVTLPQFLLSGVFFSTDVFPSWVRIFADNLPLSYFNTAMRHIAAESASFTELLPSILGLCAWGVAAYLVASRTFKWV